MMKDNDGLLNDFAEIENDYSGDDVRPNEHRTSFLRNITQKFLKKGRSKASSDRKEYPRFTLETYDEYLAAVRSMGRDLKNGTGDEEVILSARERHRRISQQNALIDEAVQALKEDNFELTNSTILATMVPDEVIYDSENFNIREYDVALMFIDVSGFSDLCERYNKMGEGGPSRLTAILNSYMGPMIQEILLNNGDLLKFAGDAFISMWKKTDKFSMHDISHAALDCALVIQKNYGSQATEVGVNLKVKIAIAAGHAYFSLIGDSISHYIILGEPVWNVKAAEKVAAPGDVIVSPSLWQYAHQGEYYTELCPDGHHTRVLGVGPLWKQVETIGVANIGASNEELEDINTVSVMLNYEGLSAAKYIEMSARKYSLRQSVDHAVRCRLTCKLRHYVSEPVQRALELAEPLEYLAEMRHVVVVIVDAVARPVPTTELVKLVDEGFRLVYRETLAARGVLNKVSLFDKGITYLSIFGLRGYKSEDEASRALLCSQRIFEVLNNIKHMSSVSIGVTSGATYCGVVGHRQRREYTVIGPAVNKAARLMTHYENMVSCDKETYLRSKMEQEYFTLLQPKELKGIANPGPVYKFAKPKLSKCKIDLLYYPLLGHESDLKLYKKLLYVALNIRKSTQDASKAETFRSLALIGPKGAGKNRLLEEFLHITPSYVPVSKIIYNEEDKQIPYKLIQRIFYEALGVNHHDKPSYEVEIEARINLSKLTLIEIHAFNIIFNCKFPLPVKFRYSGDLSKDLYVKKALQELCLKVFPSTWIITVTNTHLVDDDSWRILPIILSSKTVFLVLAFTLVTTENPEAAKVLQCKYLTKIELHGLGRWLHAALACQLLDVLGIPADLEKVIQTWSKGMPGWIRSFLVALQQSNHLRITTMTRMEAIDHGTVLPPLHMVYRGGALPRDKGVAMGSGGWSLFKSSYKDSKIYVGSVKDVDTSRNEKIKVAVLEENYKFEDMNFDLTMDTIILKTYDSLTPFEKRLVKCCSVLNETFTRRMLEHLIQSDTHRKVALAVAKLFEIGVLRCEGGDFTRERNAALVPPAPAHMSGLHANSRGHCFCIGRESPSDCKDLPPYAFCGYMKFRKIMFRTSMYKLLTECQKRAFHMRATVFLERYARRCISCGGDCFTMILGQRYNDGMYNNTPLMLQRYLMLKYSEENNTRIEQPGILKQASHDISIRSSLPSFNTFSEAGRGAISNLSVLNAKDSQHNLMNVDPKVDRVRSFSSLDMTNCECVAILVAIYSQIIPQCRGAGEYEKLIEAYLEYAALSVYCHNVPQAMRLLNEVEDFVKGDVYRRVQKNDELSKWFLKYVLGRIYSLRGFSYLSSDDLSQAHKCLHQAMDYYCCPFPTSKEKVKLFTASANLKQALAPMLNMAPSLFIKHAVGIDAIYFEDVAGTLNHLYKLFTVLNDINKARLAAKWSFNLAVRSDSNFSLMCMCYANMITVSRIDGNWSKCMKLKKQSMELCHRKYSHLEVRELDAVCSLYDSIFFMFAWRKLASNALELGLSVLPLLTKSWQGGLILIWLPHLLVSQLRIGDALAVVKELFSVTNYNHLSAETWYYSMALSVHLDTGCCVELFSVCEHFYTQHRDEMLHLDTPAALYTFIAVMWLMCMRTCSWERALMWEDKMQPILRRKLQDDRLNTDMALRLVEGFIIKLVKEIDNRNAEAVGHLEFVIKRLFKQIAMLVKQMPLYSPRYHLMMAYFDYVRHKERTAFKKMLRSYHEAKHSEDLVIVTWCEHILKHWRGHLDPLLVNYWVDHTKKGCQLHFRKMDQELKSFVPYTLPLPKHWRGHLDPLLVNYWVDHTKKGCQLHFRKMDQELKSFVPYTLPLPKVI